MLCQPSAVHCAGLMLWCCLGLWLRGLPCLAMLFAGDCEVWEQMVPGIEQGILVCALNPALSLLGLTPGRVWKTVYGAGNSVECKLSAVPLYDLSGLLKHLDLMPKHSMGAVAPLPLHYYPWTSIFIFFHSAFSGATEGRSWAASLLSCRQNPGDRPQALLGLGAESVLRLLY